MSVRQTDRVDTASRLRIGYLLLAAADTVAALAGEPARRVRRLTKPALMPTLGGYLHAAADQEHPRLRRATLAGLALSAVGDVALLRRGDAAFTAGLGAFLLAHLAYLRGFAATRATAASTERAPVRRAWPAAAVLACTAPVLWRRAGELRGPVMIYAGAIAGMLCAALTLDGAVPRPAARRIGAGAAAFVLSDALIAAGRFLPAGRHARTLDGAVMAGYTAGQWLIADGVARATRG